MGSHEFANGFFVSMSENGQTRYADKRMVLDMEHAPDICYAALRARDRRFDGLFYVGVSTTGVYCRPICPARLPRQDRCEFFGTAAQAETAGYRACLRCRPELAPGFASVDATSTVAVAAARRIQRGALNTGTVEDLADRLGVTTRHLRRVVKSELGVTPIELAQTHRLGAAKRLLHDTSLPMTTVAHAAGFGSVRRFNAVFSERFGRPPTEVRRRKSSDQYINIRLDFRPPLQWDALLEFIAGRAVPGVCEVAHGVYSRTLRIDDARGRVTVRRCAEHALDAQISIELAPHLVEVVSRLTALFDLDARPDVIGVALAADPLLADVVGAYPGLRVPGTVDGFEVAVRTILGQQITVSGATKRAGRFVEVFGDQVDGELYFPTPDRIASATQGEVQAVGMPARRAQTLIDLAGSGIDLSAGADPQATIDALLEIKGIGPWTANYIAMRALRWPDAYPVGDLILDRRGGTREAAEKWRPWRAYAAMYLWKKGD